MKTSNKESGDSSTLAWTEVPSTKRRIFSSHRPHDTSEVARIAMASIGWAPTPDCRVSLQHVVQKSITTSIHKLNQTYEFSDHTLIERFILRYQTVLLLLETAPSEIRKRFGSNLKRLSLSLFSETDINTNAILFIIITTDLSPNIAKSRLEQLDEEWFIEQCSHLSGKINVALEYSFG